MTNVHHESPSPIGTIAPRATHEQLAQSLVLDVRTPAEFEEAHVEGAILHPLTELDPALVQKLAAGKRACVVVCRSGGRARQAAEKLAAHGLPALQVMAGGMQGWEQEGLPVQRGRKTISLERQVRIAAGGLVVLGSTLGYLIHPGWIALSAFVGAGLMFAGITDTCGMAMILARMPWNTRRAPTAASCCSMK